jgi:hypothetical protein
MCWLVSPRATRRSTCASVPDSASRIRGPSACATDLVMVLLGIGLAIVGAIALQRRDIEYA